MDGIPYIALHKGPKIILEIFADLYNTSYKLGYMPQKWKTAHTIFIPNPHKNSFMSDNYRPIMLTNTIPKICESILAKRLNLYLEDSNLLSRNQAEFRERVSTTDQVLRIITDTQSALDQGMKAAAIFMDLTAAFDTVWHDGLLYKLYALNLPSTTIRWAHNFLQQWTTRIKFGKEYSNIHIGKGVPQGYV